MLTPNRLIETNASGGRKSPNHLSNCLAAKKDTTRNGKANQCKGKEFPNPNAEKLSSDRPTVSNPMTFLLLAQPHLTVE
jgi:hypothetical protein